MCMHGKHRPAFLPERRGGQAGKQGRSGCLRGSQRDSSKGKDTVQVSVCGGEPGPDSWLREGQIWDLELRTGLDRGSCLVGAESPRSPEHHLYPTHRGGRDIQRLFPSVHGRARANQLEVTALRFPAGLKCLLPAQPEVSIRIATLRSRRLRHLETVIVQCNCVRHHFEKVIG